MRLIALPCGLLCALATQIAAAGSNAVLVELFTSEGCSSCPSADGVLSNLKDNDNVALLGWHVDYWDHLGWKDRFGHEDATTRQRAYAAALARGRMYTPQMVVNGEAEFVGSDRLRAKRSIETAGDQKRVPIELMITKEEGKLAVVIAIDKTAKSEGAIYLAITEDNLVSQVTRGENAGRTLHHDGVVRQVFELGALGANNRQRRISATIDKGWNTEHLNVVAWIQDTKTLEVLGVAQAHVKEKMK